MNGTAGLVTVMFSTIASIVIASIFLSNSFQGSMNLLRTNITEDMQLLRTGIAEDMQLLRTDIAKDMQLLRTDIAKDLDILRADITEDMNVLRADMSIMQADIKALQDKTSRMDAKLELLLDTWGIARPPLPEIARN